MNSAGKLLAAALAEQGVEFVYAVAGESYLPVLDGLLNYPAVKLVTCRHESGAAFMAEAYGQLTGKPGIAMVTRGPGACNASIGIHAARQSSTPVILFVGLVTTADRGREAFQEFDVVEMFGSHSKWATVIDSPERIPEFVARAFHVSVSGRPGPVVIGLPEDVLFASAEMAGAAKIFSAPHSPSMQELSAVAQMLSEAERPLIVAGGGGWDDAACEDLASFSSVSHIPVACSFRRQDIFNHHHGNYIGELGTGPNPKLVKRVGQADVVLVLGARLSEITTQGYTIFKPGQKLVHVYPDASVFGRYRVPDLAVEAHPALAAAALAGARPLDGRRWAGWRDEARADYLEWTEIPAASRRWNGADMTQVFRQLRELLPRDAIVTTDAGNFSGWCQRYLKYGRPGRLLAPLSGAMGYAVPSAVSAALAQPGKIVIGVCGDGGFMMTGNELATAVHHGAKPVIIICNNGMYGTIRMHQEKHYPGRVSATSLTNPDFVAFTESFGAFAVRVSDAEQFTGAWKRALSSGKLSVIEISMDPRQITTNAKP